MAMSWMSFAMLSIFQDLGEVCRTADSTSATCFSSSTIFWPLTSSQLRVGCRLGSWCWARHGFQACKFFLDLVNVVFCSTWLKRPQQGEQSSDANPSPTGHHRCQLTG